MPPEWKITPDWFLFIFTYIISALTGLGVEFISPDKKPSHITYVLGIVWVYGGMGSALGMFVGYALLPDKFLPWSVVGCGTLVGVRAIKVKDAGNIMRRIFQIPMSGIDEKKKDDDNHDA